MHDALSASEVHEICAFQDTGPVPRKATCVPGNSQSVPPFLSSCFSFFLSRAPLGGSLASRSLVKLATA